ncbi:hypothetical protein HI030_06440 [Staphylococcus haemolyticus]|nr:hypothetical protein HI030_06440 [Staphylococcus haemolyticus]
MFCIVRRFGGDITVVTSTGSVVVALPVKSLVTTGAVGGVVSVACLSTSFTT